MAKHTRSELKDTEPAPVAPPAPGSVAPGGSGFIDVDMLEDANGLIAIISQRRSNGTMTMAVFKKFDRDGKVERTSFIPEPLFDAHDALWKLARDRVLEIQANGLAPIKIEQRGAGDRKWQR